MENKTRITGLAVGMALLVSSAVPLSAGDVQNYTDTTELTEHLKGKLKSISALTKSDSLPVFYLFLDTFYNPAEGVKCVLETRRGREEKYSDKNGEVLFWVPRSQRSKVKFNAYCSQPVNHYSSAMGCVPIGDSTEVVNLGFFGSIRLILKLMRETRQAPLKMSYGMPEIEGEGIRVLYPEKYKSEAEVILEHEKKCKAVIDSILRMRLMPLKVVIEEEQAPFGLHFDGGWWTTARMQSGFVLGTLPHEWVETSLGVIYLDVTSDYSTRWIGDGLANYTMFEIEKRYHPIGLSYLHNEEWSGYDPEKTYDLKTWKGGDVTDLGGGRSVGMFGYLIAPYFWAKVVEKSGNPQLIPQFLEELRASENKSSDTAIAILSRLSGLDIASELVITGSELRENFGRYWPSPDTATGSDE
ncbi:hypothetical protein CEE36_05830 [candidate division TA06 bacterium B3_TA06]|uniref:Uncharacterized protein n=1 Tax=candidate division TA06 bacterium B3_TA06 TaxID=2012487 RepID=A0A532V731_UNCT6|nr:MAG: hypothetical protein CEE36_05830 [candidate division TA06 bacterium B3_TA06]